MDNCKRQPNTTLKIYVNGEIYLLPCIGPIPDPALGDTDRELAQANDPCEATDDTYYELGNTGPVLRPPVVAPKPTGRVVDCTGALTVQLPTCSNSTVPPEGTIMRCPKRLFCPSPSTPCEHREDHPIYLTGTEAHRCLVVPGGCHMYCVPCQPVQQE